MRNRVNNDGFISDRYTEDFSFNIEGNASISGSLFVSGSATLSGALTLTSNLTVTGNVGVTGGGLFRSGLTGSIGLTVTTSLGTDTLNVGSNTVVFLDATAAPFTVTLPNATTLGSGSFFHIKKTDSTSNAITISASNSQLIDGAATQVITEPYISIKLVSNANNWWIL